MQECIAARIMNLVEVGTKVNLNDFLMKGTACKTHHYLTDVFFGLLMAGDKVDVVEVNL